MATLTGSTVASTYTQLLKLTSATLGADASAKYIEDGAGTDSALSISTTRIGIGTAAPSGTVDIKRADAVTNPATDTNAGLLIENTNASGSAILRMRGGDGAARIMYGENNSTDKLYFSPRNEAANYVVIDHMGSVGIGVAAPEAQLNIAKAGSSDNATFYIDTFSSGINSQSVIGLRKSNSNSVGTETTVEDDEKLGKIAWYGGETDGYDEAASIHAEVDGTPGSNDTDMPGALVFGTTADGTGSTAERMRITSAGNVGINETSPAHKLDVDGGIVEQGGVLKENLLTNSGFDVWSNSTLENVGSDFVTNGTFASDSDWSKNTGWTITGEKGVASSAGSTYAISQSISQTVVGKLYRFKVTISDYSAGGIYFHLIDGDTASPTLASDGTHEVVVEMKTAHTALAIRASGTTTLKIDDVSFYEVTPGCVAADTLAMDGWYKDSGLDLYRQHNDGGTLTKDGSFYSLKIVTDGTDKNILWNYPEASNAEFTQRFAGRTVTLGAWVKASDASHIRLAVFDGSWNNGDFHTGGGAWEWLEFTHTVSASVTTLFVTIRTALDAKTTYVSQPMLVFGSSIGEGNYTRPQGEIVWLEDPTTSVVLTGSGHSDVADSGVNLEADTLGKMPKGAKAIWVNIGMRDSGSAGSNVYLGVQGIGDFLDISISGLANDSYGYSNQSFPLDSSGDYDYRIEASGSATFDFDHFKIYGVQLR